MTDNVPGQYVLPDMVEELGYVANSTLTSKHELFCWEFVRSGDAQASYAKAYSGCKQSTANTNGCRLSNTAPIKVRIAEIRAELSRRYNLDAQALIQILSESILHDKRDFLDRETGVPLELHQLDSQAARLVDLEIVVDRHGTRRAIYKTPRLLDTIGELAKIVGLYKQTLDIHGGNGATSNVNFYLPDNGRDVANKMEELRDQFKAILVK